MCSFLLRLIFNCFAENHVCPPCDYYSPRIPSRSTHIFRASAVRQLVQKTPTNPTYWLHHTFASETSSFCKAQILLFLLENLTLLWHLLSSYIGATGNAGRETVRTLSKLLETSQVFSGYRLLARTRSSNSLAAQQLAKLPHVEVEEYHWPEITPNWLRKREVTRAFIASHNQPNQFAEESTFHLAALRAGVKCCEDLNNSCERTSGL